MNQFILFECDSILKKINTLKIYEIISLYQWLKKNVFFFFIWENVYWFNSTYLKGTYTHVSRVCSHKVTKSNAYSLIFFFFLELTGDSFSI